MYVCICVCFTYFHFFCHEENHKAKKKPSYFNFIANPFPSDSFFSADSIAVFFLIHPSGIHHLLDKLLFEQL